MIKRNFVVLGLFFLLLFPFPVIAQGTQTGLDPTTTRLGSQTRPPNRAGVSDPTPQQRQQAIQDASTKGAGACSGWRYLLPNCWTQAIATAIGSTIAFIASWFMLGMGAFFDWSTATLVAEFGVYFPTFYSGISEVWITFRNLANIAIVGFFTFIAISIILGLKTYGQKKLIANVLIAATLINFSLLFVNIALTSSNMLSAVMYEQMLKSAAAIRPGTNIVGYQGSATPGESMSGPSRAFLRAMRYDQFGDVAKQLERAGNKAPNFPLAGSAVVLIYAILISLMFCVAGILFIYGAFLLVSRFIMFIILMLTAPFAFATFIMPSLSSSTFGWSGWWSSLIRTSMLAPLMMLLLWGTMSIIEKASAALQTTGAFQDANIGDLAVGAAAGAAGKSDYFLLVFDIIVLGLIYASFKMSSSFAHSIGGFNFAAAFPAGAFGVVARLGGVAGRNVLGRGLETASGRLAFQGNKNSASSSYGRQALGFLQQGLGARLDKLGKNASFNMAKTRIGDEFAGLAKFGAETRKAIEGKGAGLESAREAFRKGASEAIKNTGLTPEQHVTATGAAIAQADKERGGDSVEKLQKAVDDLTKAVHHSEESLTKATEDLAESKAIAKTREPESVERLELEHKNALNGNASKIEVLTKQIALLTAQRRRASEDPSQAGEVQRLSSEITRVETERNQEKIRVDRLVNANKKEDTVIATLEATIKTLDGEILAERTSTNRPEVIDKKTRELQEARYALSREKRTIDDLKKERQKLLAVPIGERDNTRIEEIEALIGNGKSKKHGTLHYSGTIALALEQKLRSLDPNNPRDAAEIRDIQTTLSDTMKIEAAQRALAEKKREEEKRKAEVYSRWLTIKDRATEILRQKVGNDHTYAFLDPARAKSEGARLQHHTRDEALESVKNGAVMSLLERLVPEEAKRELEKIKKSLAH